MQDSINVSGPASRAISVVLGSLECGSRAVGQPSRTAERLGSELAQGARLEGLVWLVLALASLAGLMISLWI